MLTSNFYTSYVSLNFITVKKKKKQAKGTAYYLYTGSADEYLPCKTKLIRMRNTFKIMHTTQCNTVTRRWSNNCNMKQHPKPRLCDPNFGPK